jgi:predicted nucleotidyltransferase
MNLNFTDIKNVVASLKLNILFVGAGARILIFDTQYNVEGRATKDLDFAVQEIIAQISSTLQDFFTTNIAS